MPTSPLTKEQQHHTNKLSWVLPVIIVGILVVVIALVIVILKQWYKRRHFTHGAPIPIPTRFSPSKLELQVSPSLNTTPENPPETLPKVLPNLRQSINKEKSYPELQENEQNDFALPSQPQKLPSNLVPHPTSGQGEETSQSHTHDTEQLYQLEFTKDSTAQASTKTAAVPNAHADEPVLPMPGTQKSSDSKDNIDSHEIGRLSSASLFAKALSPIRQSNINTLINEINELLDACYPTSTDATGTSEYQQYRQELSTKIVQLQSNVTRDNFETTQSALLAIKQDLEKDKHTMLQMQLDQTQEGEQMAYQQ